MYSLKLISSCVLSNYIVSAEWSCDTSGNLFKLDPRKGLGYLVGGLGHYLSRFRNQFLFLSKMSKPSPQNDDPTYEDFPEWRSQATKRHLGNPTTLNHKWNSPNPNWSIPTACCGPHPYNDGDQDCCVIEINGFEEHKVYDVNLQTCCNGMLLDSGHGCCGGLAYDKSREGCCGGSWGGGGNIRGHYRILEHMVPVVGTLPLLNRPLPTFQLNAMLQRQNFQHLPKSNLLRTKRNNRNSNQKMLQQSALQPEQFRLLRKHE